MFNLIILALFIVVIIVGLAYFIQGPPYVPSSDESAQQILAEVKRLKPEHILDMGSGDGKLVIMLAKEGYRVDGIELNPKLVLKSRRAIKKAGLTDKATIKWGSFWSYDASKYDLVVLYVIKHIMPRLEKKLTAELSPGSHVVSNFFVFPSLEPIRKAERTRVYKI